MRAMLIVPCDIQRSGLVVFATRLREELGRQHVPTGVAMKSSAMSTDALVSFATGKSLSRWLIDSITEYDVLCWMGFYQEEEEVEDQILSSVLLRERFGKRVFFLWERTGSANVVPSERLRRLLIGRGADGVIALNREQIAALEGFGRPSCSVHLIPPGVDTRQEYRPICSDSERHEIRRTLGWPVEDVVVLSVGRFVRRKRTDFLIRTWLADTWLQENARLVVVGSGFGQSDSVESEVYRLASRSSGVVAIPHCDDMDRSVYYRGADLFVLAGILEGEPSVLVEAAACGLPIAASNIPGHTGLVCPGQTGLLFEPDDPDHLRRVLHKLVGNESYRAGLGKQARRFVARERDIAVTAGKFIKAFCSG